MGQIKTFTNLMKALKANIAMAQGIRAWQIQLAGSVPDRIPLLEIPYLREGDTFIINEHISNKRNVIVIINLLKCYLSCLH